MKALNAIRKIRPAHAVAVAALLIACGGTSYAAATIGSAQIIDNSIRSVDLKDNAVRSVDIKNNSVSSSDVADYSLGAHDLSSDAQDAFKNKWRINGTAKQVAGGQHVTEKVYCDYENGEFAAGGGGYSYYNAQGYLTGSSPVYGTGDFSDMPVGWEVKMQNLSGNTNYLIIRVQCVKG